MGTCNFPVRTSGSARFVFPSKQNPILTARRGQQTLQCLQLALKKYPAAVRRTGQCSLRVVCNEHEQDRMRGTPKGIQWGESPGKQI